MEKPGICKKCGRTMFAFKQGSIPFYVCTNSACPFEGFLKMDVEESLSNRKRLEKQYVV